MNKRIKLKFLFGINDYLHRYIKEDKLINILFEISKLRITNNEKEIMADLLDKIEYEIKNNYQNIERDKAGKERDIKELSDLLSTSNSNEKYTKKINSMIVNVLNDQPTLFKNISQLLTSCSIYNKYVSKLNNKELMELITRYIGGPMPNVDKETIDLIIDEAIKTGIPEKAWRIAFNFDSLIKDKSKIEEFIISSGSAFHIAEMANGGFIGIHVDKLVDGIIATKDIKEMSYFIISLSDTLSIENKLKVENAIKNLNGWGIYQEYINRPDF